MSSSSDGIGCGCLIVLVLIGGGLIGTRIAIGSIRQEPQRAIVEYAGWNSYRNLERAHTSCSRRSDGSKSCSTTWRIEEQAIDGGVFPQMPRYGRLSREPGYRERITEYVDYTMRFVLVNDGERKVEDSTLSFVQYGSIVNAIPPEMRLSQCEFNVVFNGFEEFENAELIKCNE